MEIAQRLIVAADFDPRQCGGRPGVRSAVAGLAQNLRELEVILKVNSALRDRGYGFIADLRAFGVGIFADLKLCDIPATMALDAALLAENPPDILTVMCAAGVEGMKAVKDVLGSQTMVLGVTVLTSLDEKLCQQLYGNPPRAMTLMFAKMALEAGLDGLILSPQELSAVRSVQGLAPLCLVTPGIRPAWASVPGDDQKRVATPAEAIRDGANRIVIGRPITGAKSNDQGLPQSPREAAERTLAEIAVALAI